MTGDQIAQLIYLVLLTSAVGGFFIMQNRRNMGRMAQQAAIWGFIFLGVIAGVGLWGDIRSTVAPRQAVFADQGRIEVPRAPDGHYYLTLSINDVPVRFVVDTGASDLVLSRADAARVGIDAGTLAFSGQANTANGVVRTARVRLNSVQAGPLRDNDIAAWVSGGDMDSSLLGMAYLGRFQRLEISNGKMILTR